MCVKGEEKKNEASQKKNQKITTKVGINYIEI